MKTIFIGDVHGRATWKLMVHQENPDRVIFVGDYFDSFDIPGVDQIHNFKEIIEYKKTSGKEVVLLIGNHDHHYLPEIGYTGTSGYQYNLAPSIIQVVDENREHLQMAYQFENILCTHAGVSSVFMDNTYRELELGEWSIDTLAADLNELFKHKPKLFCFTPTRFGDNYGNSEGQTPIWIRPDYLMKANKESVLKKDLIQVVGHTHQSQIDIKGKSTGGKYYFIDTQGSSGEYLIYENSEFKVGKSR